MTIILEIRIRKEAFRPYRTLLEAKKGTFLVDASGAFCGILPFDAWEIIGNIPQPEPEL